VAGCWEIPRLSLGLYVGYSCAAPVLLAVARVLLMCFSCVARVLLLYCWCVAHEAATGVQYQGAVPWCGTLIMFLVRILAAAVIFVLCMYIAVAVHLKPQIPA
jgi:hypothetical protein